MKIFQIVGSLGSEAAGPSYSVPRLSRALVERGSNVCILSVGKGAHDEIMGVEHRIFDRSFGPGPFSKLWRSKELKKVLWKESESADIFHVHGLWTMPTVYPSDAIAGKSTKLIVSPRGMLSPAALAYSPFVKRIFWLLKQRSALSVAVMLHATSEQEFDDIRSAGLEQPVAVIRNGIDIPNSDDFLESKICRKSARSVLFIGRLHPIKRLENLIAAWGELEPQLAGWHLDIRGPGEVDYIETLQRFCETLGVKRCRFGGPLYGRAKFEAFRDASFSVLPSASENFGMTVAESLACGTPVIATKGTPWEGLELNRCGWWVEHGKDSLKLALAEATSLSEDRLNAMGERGRKWMERDFSWDAIAREFGAAYGWLKHGGEPPSTIQL